MLNWIKRKERHFEQVGLLYRKLRVSTSEPSDRPVCWANLLSFLNWSSQSQINETTRLTAAASRLLVCLFWTAEDFYHGENDRNVCFREELAAAASQR